MSAPRERGLICRGPEALAIWSGRQTQVRRLVKPQPAMGMDGFRGIAHHVRGAIWRSGLPGISTCPFGKVGDLLFVKETHGFLTGAGKRLVFAADGTPRDRFSGEEIRGMKWRPSTHMTRELSRSVRQIAEVRIERLTDISEADAIANGAESWSFCDEQPMTTGEMGAASPYRGGFAVAWDEQYDEVATWKSNPLAWVLSLTAAPSEGK